MIREDDDTEEQEDQQQQQQQQQMPNGQGNLDEFIIQPENDGIEEITMASDSPRHWSQDPIVSNHSDNKHASRRRQRPEAEDSNNRPTARQRLDIQQQLGPLHVMDRHVDQLLTDMEIEHSFYPPLPEQKHPLQRYHLMHYMAMLTQARRMIDNVEQSADNIFDLIHNERHTTPDHEPDEDNYKLLSFAIKDREHRALQILFGLPPDGRLMHRRVLYAVPTSDSLL